MEEKVEGVDPSPTNKDRTSKNLKLSDHTNPNSETAKTSPAIIKQHYQDQRIRDIIHLFANYQGTSKAGNYDFIGWYKKGKKGRRLLDLADPHDYGWISKKMSRVLYGTLNYFEKNVFDSWKSGEEDSSGGFEDTAYYMLSVDIDLTDNHTVEDDKSLEFLETAAQFIYQRLFEVTGGKVLVLFSGNGVYIHLHPGFAHLPPEYQGSERAELYYTLTKAFNLHLQVL